MTPILIILDYRDNGMWVVFDAMPDGDRPKYIGKPVFTSHDPAVCWNVAQERCLMLRAKGIECTAVMSDAARWVNRPVIARKDSK